MSHWIKLDPEQLNVPIPNVIEGVQVDVFLSPFDVPNKVRGRFDDAKDHFVIEFDYAAGKEPPVEREVDDHVTLVFGRNSQRLYRLEIDVRGSGANAVQLRMNVMGEIKKAFARLSSVGDKRRIWHYEAARRAIDEKEEDLLEAVQ